MGNLVKEVLFPSGNTYTLTFSEDDKFQSCNCPDWVHRKRPIGGGACKHVAQLLQLEANQLLIQTVIAKAFEKGWVLDFTDTSLTKLDDEEDEEWLQDQATA